MQTSPVMCRVNQESGQKSCWTLVVVLASPQGPWGMAGTLPVAARNTAPSLCFAAKNLTTAILVGELMVPRTGTRRRYCSNMLGVVHVPRRCAEEEGHLLSSRTLPVMTTACVAGLEGSILDF